MIGVFLALLELIRQKKILVHQPQEGPDQLGEVVIEPGYILGPYGDEIVIDREVTINACTQDLDGNVAGPCGQPADPWCSNVRIDRRAGDKLYLASHAGGIEGWPVPEARAFLRDLTEHATQRKFVYAHVWRPYDLVMWDNRVTMHRARRYDHTEVRDMRRTTLTNEVSSLEQAP